MKQFFAFIKKEFLHVIRDSKTLLMLFGLPIVQIALFGFALSNEVKEVNMLVCNLSNDSKSIELIQKFNASGNFKVLEVIHDPNAFDQHFKKGNIKMILLIPANFEENIIRNGKVEVQLITDSSDPNLATTLTSYSNQIVMDFQTNTLGQSNLPGINPEVHMMYNPSLKGTTNFVPGVISLIMMLICVLMTSVSIVKEKELGTMEVLLVSPFHPFFIIISKAIPYFVLSLFNLGVIVFLSVTLLDMPMEGSFFLLFAESGLLILVCLSLGLLISNSTNSQQAAMLISLLGMLIPTLIFTGFLFPIENMPLPLKIISNIMPSKWYYIIVKDIMIKGLGIQYFWKETLILMAMAIGLLGLSLKKFKIRL
jgi:ABC-2 type transport system permease protein